MDEFNKTCFIYLALIYVFNCALASKQVPIKIVQEPTNYGYNGGGYQQQDTSTPLVMRVKPANFSGPVHLKHLHGHCFTKIFDTYKYELCPFENITQHEQSLRWNPYSGVLGVWQEWTIENNTFTGMLMSEGDVCGKLYRSTKILLRCGETSEILSVTEPHTCQYELVFTTPLVCHPHSLLVYPTLPRLLQREWDVIEGRLLAEEITQQGYNKLLQKLFEKAGYRLAAGTKQKLAEEAKQKETENTEVKAETFDTLYQCQAEYNKLKEDVASLRTLLRVNNISDNTQAHHPKDQNIGDIHSDYNHMDYDWMHDRGDY